MIYYAISNGTKYADHTAWGRCWFCDSLDDAKLFKTRKGAENVIKEGEEKGRNQNLQIVEVEVTRRVRN